MSIVRLALQTLEALSKISPASLARCANDLPELPPLGTLIWRELCEALIFAHGREIRIDKPLSQSRLCCLCVLAGRAKVLLLPREGGAQPAEGVAAPSRSTQVGFLPPFTCRSRWPSTCDDRGACEVVPCLRAAKC